MNDEQTQDTQTEPTVDTRVKDLGLRKKELAYAVLDRIKNAGPGEWKQELWICQTGGCFAGWACMLSGFPPFFSYHYDSVADYVVDPESTEFLTKWNEDYVSQGLFRVTPIRDKAHELLGIEDSIIGQRMPHFPYGGNLFAGQNSLETIEALVLEIFGPRD